MKTPLRALLVAAMLASVIAVPSSATAAPATPDFGPSIDAYAAYDGQRTCDASEKPGVAGFRDILNATYGWRNSGIGRACNDGGQSEHKEGRALDYVLNYNDGGQRAVADDILNWLLTTDRYGNANANARRLGVMYIIWNRRIWYASDPYAGWQNYSCSGDPSDCHTNHIHFSFSWAGALKQTSWWRSAAAQVYEAGGGSSGWQPLPVSGSTGPVSGSAVSTFTAGGVKYIYTVRGGQVFEAASNAGWRNLWTGIGGVDGGAVAAMVHEGVKYVYTVVGGVVHEASSANGWRNISTGITGASGNTLSVISLGGVKYIYTVVGGVVHEAHSANGWRNLSTGVPATSVAVTTLNGVKIIYTVRGGQVFEAASNAGWQNLWTGIAGVSDAALAATTLNGVKYIYTVAGGVVHEAHSANGWRNLSTGVGGSRVSALTLNSLKILYTM
ncbi:hypothetical protein Cme02nite_28130 [Catellatospora methionotrophica]|uniref:ARB-07466-like C-terminal domain-containing protein n=1 Tax=Catellatospora methionotrophica TaxID=121620 RepID=A0A8J3LG14_9ACTN|nr:hypothetical protein [Catellatospora methionotrophica]GIG14481.1 hypothetical protein Cme02nite_28130 [Catellatospora methionotrophica]